MERMFVNPCLSKSATRCPPINPPPPHTTILSDFICKMSAQCKCAAHRGQSFILISPLAETRDQEFRPTAEKKETDCCISNNVGRGEEVRSTNEKPRSSPAFASTAARLFSFLRSRQKQIPQRK